MTEEQDVASPETPLEAFLAEPPPDPTFYAHLSRLHLGATWAARAVLALAAAALFCAALQGFGLLTVVVPPMRPSPACNAALQAGVLLAFLRYGHLATVIKAIRVVTLMLAVLTVGEIAGIDTWFGLGAMGTQAWSLPLPSRGLKQVELLLFLTTLSIFALTHTLNRRIILCLYWACLPPIFCGVMALCAAFYRPQNARALVSDTLLPPWPAAVVSLLGLAVFLASPTNPVVRQWIGTRLGAALGRRLVGISCVAVVIMGALGLALQAHGLVAQQEGTALLVTCVLGLIASTTWLETRLINRHDAQRNQVYAQLVEAARINQRLLQSLQRERALTSSVLRAAKDYGIVAVARDGTIELFNDGATRLLGYTPSEAIGKPLMTLLHDSEEIAVRTAVLDVAANFEVFSQLIEKNGTETRRWLGRHRDGSQIPLSITLSVRVDEQGTPVGLVGIGRDIREELRHAAEMDKQATFEKQLVGIVSHDLRNPLGAILMSAQRLNKSPDNAEALIGRIVSSAKRMERMIYDLLDFTQARLGGGLPVSRQAVALQKSIGAVVEEMRLQHPSRHIGLEVHGSGHANVDESRLCQVVSNLLGNAVTYSPASSPISVTLRTDTDGLTLTVHNEGNPIDKDLLPKLFTPLRRGQHAGHNPSRSLGLGLYIVEEVVRAHHGRVTVDSSHNRGTTFHIDVPNQAPK